jgi:hypothetical protein
MTTPRASVLLALCLAGCPGGGTATGDPTESTGTDGSTAGSTPGTGDEVGSSGDQPTGDPEETTGGEPAACEPLRSPLRRLSRGELRNTLGDLFPTISLPELDLPVDKPKDLFGNNVDTQEPTDVYVESHWRAMVEVADAVVADLPAATGCTLDSDAARQACVDTYVPALLRRAYRRPVAQAEVDRYLTDFLPTQWSAHGFDVAMKLTIMAVLNSPSFLYRPEFGADGADPAATMPLRGEELAVRLSYFLWQTTPDETLAAAAESGVLETKAGLEAEARRLLADPRARPAVADFHRQWLRLDGLDAVQRDEALFPAWTPELAPVMTDSLERYVAHAFWDGEGTLGSLLLDPVAFANAALAPIYGVQVAGDELELVALDGAQRAGLLTQPALMASMAHEKFDAPIKRGVYVIDRFMCVGIGAPPPDVPDIPPADPMEGPKTTRQRIEETHVQESCKSCHTLIDGVGFAFNNYDAIGMWRVTENGLPVDSTGSLNGVAGITADFNGAIALSQLLAGSSEVERCFGKQVFRYAQGRREGAGDMCALDQALAAADGDMQELMIQLVLTDNFRQRAAIEGE